MLLNSKGKFLNKINIVDMLIIILVIIAIIGAYFRFKGNNVVAENENCEFYYTLTVREVRETNKILLEKSLDTSFRLDGKVSSSMGTLVNVEPTGAITEIEKTDGSVVSATIPGKYDVVITFKVNGYKNNTGYLTPEMHEICAGKTYSIMNIYSSVEGIVDKVWIK